MTLSEEKPLPAAAEPDAASVESDSTLAGPAGSQHGEFIDTGSAVSWSETEDGMGQAEIDRLLRFKTLDINHLEEFRMMKDVLARFGLPGAEYN
jgi:hypothetical protein